MVQLDFIVMALFAVLIFGIGVAFTTVGSKSGQACFEAGEHCAVLVVDVDSQI